MVRPHSTLLSTITVRQQLLLKTSISRLFGPVKGSIWHGMHTRSKWPLSPGVTPRGATWTGHPKCRLGEGGELWNNPDNVVDNSGRPLRFRSQRTKVRRAKKDVWGWFSVGISFKKGEKWCSHTPEGTGGSYARVSTAAPAKQTCPASVHTVSVPLFPTSQLP